MRKLALSVVVFAAALLTACGTAAAPALVATAESEALAAMGVEPEELAAAQPSAPPSEKDKDRDKRRWEKRHPQKVLLHRNVLHGEAVVQTKDGNVTVVVQRGEVTAISSTSITVKSSDGFTMTWGLHPDLRVIEKRTSIQPAEIKAGANIALAGPKSGDTAQARLVVISPK